MTTRGRSTPLADPDAFYLSTIRSGSRVESAWLRRLGNRLRFAPAFEKRLSWRFSACSEMHTSTFDLGHEGNNVTVAPSETQGFPMSRPEMCRRHAEDGTPNMTIARPPLCVLS